MKTFLKLNFFLIIILSGCSNESQNIDQLTNEVLSSASSCDEGYERYLQEQINGQRSALQRGSLTEQQMIKSLQNMKQKIKCD